MSAPKKRPRLEIVSGDHRITFMVSDNGCPYLSHDAGDRGTGTPLTMENARQIQKWVTAVLGKGK